MRPIDADKLIYTLGVSDEDICFKEMLDDAPTIDAVEVIRCKDCKWVCYCETENFETYVDCNCPDGGGVPRNEKWYCADGERKDHE